MRSLVLVLGAGGQLGEAMVQRLPRRHEVVAFGREELDITNASAARSAIGSVVPDIIINCAAYNAVDAADEEPTRALAANAYAVRTLARIATELKAMLVHYSTDFVFDGRTSRPYHEDDPPHPQGMYATSKLLGEWFAVETPKHYVLRVESLFGGPKAKSSVDRLLDALLAGTEVRAFSDRTVSPSYVDDVVEATGALIENGAPFGVYHCVNSGWTTWVGVAHELARLSGRSDVPVTEIRMADARLPVPRPAFAALANDKLVNAGVTMPTWQDALARYVHQRK